VKTSGVTDLCLRRPVTTAMVFAALTAVGLASAWRIPLETYPELTYPRLTLSASWPGASPEAMESFITARLEGEAATLEGVRDISSTSQRGSATVTLRFSSGVRMDFVQLHLNEKLARLRTEIPATSRISASPWVPPDLREESLLTYTLTGPYDVNTLRRIADSHLQQDLARVEDVGGVQVSGGQLRQLHVLLDEAKAEALGLTRQEVIGGLAGLDDVVRTVGSVSEGGSRYEVVFRDTPEEGTDLRERVVARRGSRLIRLGEIGQVVDGYAEPAGYERLNGRDRVAIRIAAASGVNIIEVADRVRERVGALREGLPPGVQLIQEEDNSERMREELHDLELRSGLILILVFGVLLIFLKGIANPLIILSSIAVSVLLTITLFHVFGASLNMMSLAGLAMGFGMMVDNSIVVLENIHRHRHLGGGRRRAAVLGTNEVIQPILAGTGTTIIVFIPFLYLQGELKALYLPFALAVATSLVCSFLVAFTLIPSLAARALPDHPSFGDRSTSVESKGDRALKAEPRIRGDRASRPGADSSVVSSIMEGYGRILEWILDPWWHKIAVLLAVLVVGFSSWQAFDRNVARRSLWTPDEGAQQTLRVRVSAPRGWDLDVMDQVVRRFEELVHPIFQDGLVESYEASVTPESAGLTVHFEPAALDGSSPYLLRERMDELAAWTGGVAVVVSGLGDALRFGGLSGGAGTGARITLVGYNYETLKTLAEDVGRRATTHPRVSDVDTEWGAGSRGAEKQVVLALDPVRLVGYGLDTERAITFLRRYANSGGAGSIRLGGEQVAFRVEGRGKGDVQLADLMSLRIPSPSGGGARLSDVATVETRDVMPSITRINQQYSRTVGWSFQGPWELAQSVEAEVKAATVLPAGYEFEESEGYELSLWQRRQLELLLLLAVVLVFMLTAALYESLFQPFTVIMTVPLALIGVFAGYALFHRTFDEAAYMGLVLVGGIVVNNAIILVDHIQRLRGRFPRREAVIRAAQERLRPILMTMFTTVIGLLPLVLWSGSDQALWSTMAFTLCVALPVATFFTLTVIPLMYEGFDTLRGLTRRAIAAFA